MQLFDGAFSFGQHGFNGGDQLFLFFNQIGGFVGRPCFVNALTRILQIFTGFSPFDVAVAHLVGHVHNVDRIQVGNHLQVTQGDHPVLVNGAKAPDRFGHAAQAHESHND